MSDDKISAIDKIGSGGGKVAKVNVPNQDYFESLMSQGVSPQGQESTTVNTVDNSVRPSLEEEVRNLNRRVDHATASRAPEQLVAQAEDIIAKIGELKVKLEQPDLQVKQDYQRQLKLKLEHIDENLKVALDKAGVEYQKPDEVHTTLMNPIERFLGFLTHSESQLDTLTKDVKEMGANNVEFSPANMLLMQVKVNQVQQELELFTNLLNKSLESTKTLMNVQV